MSIQIKKEPVVAIPVTSEVKIEPSAYPVNSPPSAQEELASKIRIALMQAWQERWTDIQWVIQLKKLIRFYSAESVDIAEILMQQAVMGSNPNKLILTYLKHSVLSNIVPLSSVVKCISRFEDFSRPYCVIGLLSIVDTFGSRTSFPLICENPLQLSRSLLSMVHWCLKALLTCLRRIQDKKSDKSTIGSEYFTIIDRSTRTILNILDRKVVKQLMRVARADQAEQYREFEQCEMNASGTLSQISSGSIKEEIAEKIGLALSVIASLRVESAPTPLPILEVGHSPIFPAINGLVSLEAILNTDSDIQPFVDQIIFISRVMRVSMAETCREVFRACFMGFLDTEDYAEDLLWATFSFLKLPNILNKLRQQLPDYDIPGDVEAGLNMLLEYSNLLDQTDIKQINDMLSQLVLEFHKAGILTDAQKQSITQKRSEQRARLRPSDLTGANNTNTLTIVSNAESRVTSILKTLDYDPLRTSEQMVKVLNMLQGHSFDIVRLAASCLGKLHHFVTKIIGINEFASSNSEEARSNQNRTQFFDITFLMVVSIVQQNGLEITQPSPENETSFIVKWSKRWLPEGGQYKNCEMTAAEEQEKIDHILNLLLSHLDIVPSGPVSSWRELVMCLPFALQEIIYALEHKSISLEKVTAVIDHIRKQNMKCLVLVSVTYLCSYLNMVSSAARIKPMELLLYFISPQSSDSKPSQMLKSITDNIIYDILPQNHVARPVRRYVLPQERLTSQVMHNALQETFQRGWLNTRCLYTLEQLLAVRGTEWFCSELLNHLLLQSHIDDLTQSLSITLSILHMDLERLTIRLLSHYLPRMLTMSHSHMLTNPRGVNLAKLVVLCVSATRTSKLGQKESYVRRVRPYHVNVEVEMEEDFDDIDSSTKSRKMSEPQLFLSLEQELNLDSIGEKEDGEAFQSFTLREPLNRALVNLFQLLNSILLQFEVSPKTFFVVTLIQEAIKCPSDHCRFFLQFMPANMLGILMRNLPGMLSNEYVLRVCDLSSLSGRKTAARLICANLNSYPPGWLSMYNEY